MRVLRPSLATRPPPPSRTSHGNRPPGSATLPGSPTRAGCQDGAMTEGQSIVWITGPTQGIGEQLAKTVPYPNARGVNISRRHQPELETVIADLTDPTSWDVVADHFATELSGFHGERAVFIHNANYPGSGFVGEIDPGEYRKQVFANSAASLVLADAFVRACHPRFESGLVMISSASARHAMEGMAVYGAAKAGMEQWVRAVRAERKRRDAGPWVIAIRPGFVATDEML